MSELPGKKVSDSWVQCDHYRIFPNDLNHNGTVFGGLVMAHSDRVASVVAERHSRQTCVTASVDAMHFLAPALRGETLVFMAAINCTWSSSMEIGVKVLAEDYRYGLCRHILSAYFTFVAVDEETRKPIPIPPILPESDAERRRYEEANERRRRRREEAELRRQYRERFDREMRL